MRNALVALLGTTLVPGFALAAVTDLATETAQLEEGESPFGIDLTLEQSFGLATDDDMTAAAASFIAAPSYRASKHVTLTFSLGAFLEETERPGDGRRFDVLSSQTFLSVGHSRLWVEEWSGVRLSGSFTLYLPFSRDDFHNPRYPTPRATLYLNRAFGPLALRYGLGYTRYFPVNRTNDVDFVEYDDGASPRPEAYRPIGWNARDALAQSFRVVVEPLDSVAVTAQGSLTHVNTFGSSEGTPGGAVLQGTNDKWNTGFTFDVAWQLDDTYSVNGGWTNAAPLRPTGREIGGPGSDTVGGGVGALVLSPLYSQVYLDLNASF